MEKKVMNRIAKYLKGNTSLNERRAHEDWLNADPEHQKEFSRLEKIWKYSDMRLHVEEVMTEQQWERLESRLKTEDERPEVAIRPLYIRRFYYAAASIALFLVSIYFWPADDEPLAVKERGLPRIVEEEIPHIQTQLAAIDEVKSFRLPDGTQVWLDDRSTLTYDDNFNTTERQVTLSGRAFFDVHEDSAKAFVISARNTKIRVLGTSFNVSAAPDRNTVEVTVVSGQVAFNVVEGFRRASISLNANEKGVFFVDQSLLDKRSNDDPGFLSWMEKKKEEPLRVTRRRRNNVRKPMIKQPHKPVEVKRLLDHRFQWKKNLINQTVVEGEISNFSESITYERFILKITCFNQKQKKEYAQEYVIDGPIAPGETVSYKKTFLIDWLSNTSDVKIKLENVVAK